MENTILVSVIVAVIALAIFAIWRSKKNGKKCIGCPDSAACSGNCGCCHDH